MGRWVRAAHGFGTVVDEADVPGRVMRARRPVVVEPPTTGPAYCPELSGNWSVSPGSNRFNTCLLESGGWDDAGVGNAATASTEVCSSSDTSARQAFEQWEAIVSDAVLPSSIEPLASGHWHGKVSTTQFDRSSFTLMSASAQRVMRTRRQIEQASAEFLLVNIVVEGSNWTEQNGRVADSPAGSIVFFDSARPLDSRTTDNAVSAIVRAPMHLVLEHAGLVRDELPLATPMPTTGALGVVASFFRGLAELPPDETTQAATVLDSEIAGMLSSAVLLATGRSSPAPRIRCIRVSRCWPIFVSAIPIRSSRWTRWHMPAWSRDARCIASVRASAARRRWFAGCGWSMPGDCCAPI